MWTAIEGWTIWAATGSVLLIALVLRWSSKKKAKAQWQGSRIVITGGSTGLGLALAKELVELGASVTILARNQANLDKALSELSPLVRHDEQFVHSVSTDVTDMNSLELAREEIADKQEGRPVDYLFCCAGVAKPGMFMDTSVDTFEQQMQLNYLGTVKAVKAFLPDLIASQHKQKRVVLVSSAMGLVGFLGYAQYSASKFAVRGLAECLRNEFLLFDLGVSIFHASNMDSPGFAVEELTKPDLTRQIEGTSTLFQPGVAASHCLRGVENNQFHITSELVVDVMRMASNGLTPRNHIILESLFGLILPLAGLIGRKFVIDRPVNVQAAKDKKAL